MWARMKYSNLLIAVLAILLAGPAWAASPRKLVFIHHSTGGNLIADTTGSDGKGGLGAALDSLGYFVSDISYTWDAPSNTNIGDYTDIGNWYTWFADTTDQSGTPRRDWIMGAVYTEYDKDAYSASQHGSYTRTVTDPGGENTIVMIKSCYPNANVYDDNDTVPTDLYGHLYNYQDGGQYAHTESNVRAVYNQLLTYFKANQDKMFVIIINPPLISSDTTAAQAANMRELATWLRTTWLADGEWQGKNVYVWDFFNVLTDVDNHHRVVDGVEVHHTEVDSGNYTVYPGGDGGGSHPTGAGNRKATDELAPLMDLWYGNWQAWLNGSQGGDTSAPVGGGSTMHMGGISTLLLN